MIWKKLESHDETDGLVSIDTVADLADFIIWVVASRRGKFETLAFHASHNAHHFIQVGS